MDLFHDVGRLVSFQVSGDRPHYVTAPSCLLPLTGHISVLVLRLVLYSAPSSPSCLFPLTGFIPVLGLKRVLASWRISGPLELPHSSYRSFWPWWPYWRWFWAHWCAGDGLFQLFLEALLHLGPLPFWFRCLLLVFFQPFQPFFEDFQPFFEGSLTDRHRGIY